MHQFVNAIAGQKDMPLVKPDEAAARVGVMEAAYKSVKTNVWEKVGLTLYSNTTKTDDSIRQN
jgi:predicted dehydrogenase